MVIKKRFTLEKAVPWLLIIGGIIGLICSFVLTYDQIKIWQDPNYHPACSLNPVISCGDVINSKQGDILGIPGPFFGLAVFPVVITLGVVILSGTKLKRWIWQGVELGMLGGFVWALVLFFVSVYRVHALCPFCLAVDVVIYMQVWYITLYSIEIGALPLPKGMATKISTFARKHHIDIIVLWFLLVIVFILQHFWYYYGQYL